MDFRQVGWPQEIIREVVSIGGIEAGVEGVSVHRLTLGDGISLTTMGVILNKRKAIVSITEGYHLTIRTFDTRQHPGISRRGSLPVVVVHGCAIIVMI